MARASIKVWAPATVANVAVGYDILGFAIHGPGDEILLKRGSSKGLKITEITGDNGKLPMDPKKNTAGVAALKLMEYVGMEEEPLEMSIRKKMPFGSGLGSSAASAVGGVFAVNELLQTGLSKMDILRFAVEGEQIADGAWHADNVAPSLLGGMTLIRDNESLDVHQIHIPEGIQIAVIYPEVEVLTKDSRAVLSESVLLNQHIEQSGNLGGFLVGMYNSDFGLIKRALQDVIIEPQRASLIPNFYEMKEAALNCGALGFSISGAGPSMFAFCDDTLVAEKIVQSADKIYSEKNIKIKTFISGINGEGAFLY